MCLLGLSLFCDAEMKHCFVGYFFSKGVVRIFAEDGSVPWEVAGAPAVKYKGGIERLNNGNTLIAVYGGTPQFIEVTPDNKLSGAVSMRRSPICQDSVCSNQKEGPCDDR